MLGSSKVLYIRENKEAQWYPLGCLSSWSFNEDVETLDTTYRSDFETCIPTRQKYQVNASALSSTIDFKYVRDYQAKRKEVEWNIGEDYGTGYFTNLQIDNVIEEVVEWSVVIEGVGEVQDEEEIKTFDILGQLNVFSTWIGDLISPREFWYLRGRLDVNTMLIGVLSRVVQGEDLEGVLNVNVGINGNLTEGAIYAILDATYETKFDFAGYYEKLYLDKATPEDNACFKKAIFEITENGGMLINSTIVASIIAQTLYNNLKGDFRILATWSSELDKFRIYNDIIGVLEADTTFTATLTKAIIQANLIGSLNITSNLDGNLTSDLIYKSLQAIYNEDFDFENYFRLVINNEATTEDVECFKNAVLRLEENGGIVGNSVLTGKLLALNFFALLGGNLQANTDLSAELIKFVIYEQLIGVLESDTTFTATLSKFILSNTLQGSLVANSSLVAEIIKFVTYRNFNGSLNASSSLNGDLEVTMQSFVKNIANTGFTTSTNSCSAFLPSNSVYVQDETISVGDIIYNEITLTTPFNGGGLWWKIGLGESYRISSAGQVLEIDTCDIGGLP